MSVEAFFKFARERHATYLRRKAGKPRDQWTNDTILQQYRFTNVFRELDRTTVWFADNVRTPMRDKPEVLLATVLFRWFNRIETGEAIFSQVGILSGKSVWDIRDWSVEKDGSSRWLAEVRNSILSYCGKGPYVTGAYIVNSPNGMDKLTGILWCVEQFMTRDKDYPGSVATSSMLWGEVAEMLLADQTWDDPEARVGTLKSCWKWLTQHHGLGDFMAYEIVSDLRHTALLDRAPDIMTWANPGPGAARGLSRVFHGDKDYFHPRQKDELNTLMRGLLTYSQDAGFWPKTQDNGSVHVMGTHLQELSEDGLTMYGGDHAWPAWEMRDVEHTLCEFDKYERVRLGEGRPRGVFR